MREIKFRAWAKQYQTHNMFYFKLGSVYTDDYRTYIKCEGGDALKQCRLQDEDCVVMQYTGLKDKNGKEIYEGDILRFTEVDEDSAWGAEETYVTEVKWIDEVAQWRVVFPSGRRTELHCVLQIPCFYGQEVIGNIWEHPNLLESK